MANTQPVKFRYCILNTWAGCVTGTNDPARAAQCDDDENNFVIDTEDGVWWDARFGELVPVREVE